MQNTQPKSIGISRETKLFWERRTPLTPNGCKKLIESGIKVFVQPSKNRCFTDTEFSEVGCVLQEDLSDSKVILSIQEIEDSFLISEKTYMFFSNSIKGQFLKMPLIRKINDLKIRLIDYECMRHVELNKDSSIYKSGENIINFDNLVGLSATINILKAVGDLLLSKDISTPFLFTKLSYMYPTVQNAHDSLKQIGEYIVKQELPSDISPFIVGVLGNEKLRNGVEQALKLLPYIELSTQDLLEKKFEKRTDLIYIVMLKIEDIYFNKNKGTFNLDDFTNNPETYSSHFFEKYFKNLTVMINCINWERRFPKLITKIEFNALCEEENFKLLGISDISGSLIGTIDIIEEIGICSAKKPYFIYDINSKKKISSFQENAIPLVYSSNADFSASFALDASIHFNDSLLPFLNELANQNYPLSKSEENYLAKVLKMATITYNGSLTKPYKNLFESSLENEKIQKIRHRHAICHKMNLVSLKFKGHLINKGLLKKLTYNLNKYDDIDFDIIYLKIGENIHDESILYIDLFAEKYEILSIFIFEIKNCSLLYSCECNIICQNIYSCNNVEQLSHSSMLI